MIGEAIDIMARHPWATAVLLFVSLFMALDALVRLVRLMRKP